MNKKVIVIGATGLVGKELVRQLTDSPQVSEIVTLTRRPVSYASSKCTNHVVDFEQVDQAPELFKGDILFACMGTTLKQAGSIQAQRKVDLDYQLTAAELAVEQGVTHVVLVSSSGANARSFSPYLKMKGELEVGLEQLKIPQLSIVQPSLLLGERDNARLAEGLASRVMPALCKLPGLRKFRPIEAHDVATKMIALSQRTDMGVVRVALDEVFPDSA